MNQNEVAGILLAFGTTSDGTQHPWMHLSFLLVINHYVSKKYYSTDVFFLSLF